jgi:hypothetical protein
VTGAAIRWRDHERLRSPEEGLALEALRAAVDDLNAFCDPHLPRAARSGTLLRGGGR